jgi:glycosyltransferase involved in cell wall biosynthesis
VNVTASEKIPVSVALIAYNEESNMSRCLDSLRDFDDIVVVVDSRTNDRTAEISEEFGCRVFVEEWRGSGPQKQYSIDRCKNDWVLLMDADESLTPETIDTIKNLVGNATADAYGFRRKTYIGNRWIKHCAWWPDRVVRFFDRRKCEMESVNHPHVGVRGKTSDLEDIIDHHSYNNYYHFIQKVGRFASVDAAELYRQGRKANYLSPIVHGAWMFFRAFFLKRGFMGGLDGLSVSVATGVKAFFKYAILIEMQRYKD